MPPRVKRTKTFTGCSTCRSRGVKCGEEKPTCLKCGKMSLDCGGYGVALVWPGSKELRTPHRRVILSGHESSVKVLSEEQLNAVLETLDAGTSSADPSVGLFGVFPAAPELVARSIDTKHPCDPVSTAVALSEPSDDNAARSEISLQGFSRPLTRGNGKPIAQKIRQENDIAGLEKLKWRLGLAFLEPSLYDSMPISTEEGRQLMHYWVSHLGPLMLPTERLDNPFTSIIVPLALAAPDDPRESSGRKALLYSVYSLAAFNCSGCQSFSQLAGETEQPLGPKYLRLAFKQLGLSLVEANYHEPEAVLATILLLTIIGIFTDEYSDYRAHIRGGVSWIRSISKATWKRNQDASTFYQIFVCLEALRPAYNMLACDLEPQNLSLDDLSLEAARQDAISGKDSGFLPEDDPSLLDTSYYCLDKFFSITKPILECIMHINRWIFEGDLPADDEIVALEFKIMANNPDSIHFPGLNAVSEKMSQHHASTLYFATYIYYKVSLLKLPPSSVQWLVRQSVEHLDEIKILASDLKVSGLLWPLFITGCEADDKDLRARIEHFFDQRETHGIANVPAARKVMREVWRRRDRGDTGVWWQEVMAELGIDILLS